MRRVDRNELYKISFGRVRAWMVYLVGACLGSLTLPAWREFLGFLDSIYLDALDKELDERGHSYCRYADHCNVYVSSQAAAERTLASIQDWIEKRLRLQVNAAKSGVGRVWEGKFLGFRLTRQGRIGIAPESLERFKAKVRELWRGHQSGTSEELRYTWQRYVRGWWNYFQLAEDGVPLLRLEGWIRRHIRKCFWLRRHDSKGRENALRSLGIVGKTIESGLAKRPLEPSPTALRFLLAIRSCGDFKPLSSTAGCGKPHVRWCGRVTGPLVPVTRPDRGEVASNDPDVGFVTLLGRSLCHQRAPLSSGSCLCLKDLGL